MSLSKILENDKKYFEKISGGRKPPAEKIFSPPAENCPDCGRGVFWLSPYNQWACIYCLTPPEKMIREIYRLPPDGQTEEYPWGEIADDEAKKLLGQPREWREKNYGHGKLFERVTKIETATDRDFARMGFFTTSTPEAKNDKKTILRTMSPEFLPAAVTP